MSNQGELKDILGHPPNWILRWGITIIGVLVVIFIIIAHFVKYPDVLLAPVTITSSPPPVRIIIPANGKIKEILVKDKEIVSEHQLLAVLESVAKWQDVLKLETLLDSLDGKRKPASILENSLPNKFRLGKLQNLYSRLVFHGQEIQTSIKKDATAKKVQSLKNQVEKLSELNASSKQQEETLSKVAELTLKEWGINQELLKQNAISAAEVEKSEIDYLHSRRQLESMKTGIINNSIRIEELQIQVLQIQQDFDERQSSRLAVFRETMQNLKSEIEIWKKQFLIYAPVPGQTAFHDNIYIHQFFQASSELMAILPETEYQGIIGIAYLPVQGAGKVKIGTKSGIRLHSFPYQEYGKLEGTIRHIALLPHENTYMLEIVLPNELKTSYDISIPFQAEMTGTARIKTDNRSLLERIMNTLYGVLKN
ncbi:MAG: HlyD family efflux transporter periplasmic adaptor subunit [Bacteroidetes bacterium]|nr:HlyD family efflux transporter periplasmic adaptor subunit [Bacteroidota bacterium]